MVRHALVAVTLCCLLLLSQGCAPTTSAGGLPRDVANAEAEVRLAIGELAQAFSVGDAAKVVALASREMHLIHPLRGEVTYEDYSSGVLKNMKPRTGQTTTANLDRLYVEGNLAVVNITWHTVSVAPDGSRSERGERDQEVWRREADGKWRLFRGASFPRQPVGPAL